MREKYNILTIGNSTTILTTIFLGIFGAIIGYLSSKGINLPITAETLTTITVSLIFLLFGYINAKNHNTFWDKNTDEIHIPTELSEEQVAEIEQLIRYYTENEENETTENTSLSASADTLNENNEEDDVNEEDDGC